MTVTISGSSESGTATTPCGVVAIITDSEGRVVASDADFATSCPLDGPLWMRQCMNACSKAIRSFVLWHCSTILGHCLANDVIEHRLWPALRDIGKHRITCRAIGYSGDIAAKIANF